jgi:hypothetical protein
MYSQYWVRPGFSAVCLACTFMITDTDAEIRYRNTILRVSSGEIAQRFSIDINDAGEVCGNEPDAQAFLWNLSDSTRTQLGSLPGCSPLTSTAAAINELGHIVGTDSNQNCEGEAWLWTTQTGMLGIGDLPGGIFQSRSVAINNNNCILAMGNADGPPEPFLRTPDGQMTLLRELSGVEWLAANDLNDATVVVGRAFVGSYWQAAMWSPVEGVVGLYDASAAAGEVYVESAMRINAFGQVTGKAAVPAAHSGAYRWDLAGPPVYIGHLPGHYLAEGLGINDRGEVCGFSFAYEGELKGFVWDERRGIRDLDHVLDPCLNLPPEWNDPNHVVTACAAINNMGQLIVVPAYPPSQWMHFDWVLTPYVPGDLDEDGDVQLDDLALLLAHFGTAENALYAEGDIENCDGDVDLRDLTTLLANFGETYP